MLNNNDEIFKDCFNNIQKYMVICLCNTELEIEENSIIECPNCGKQIDDKGIIY